MFKKRGEECSKPTSQSTATTRKKNLHGTSRQPTETQIVQTSHLLSTMSHRSRLGGMLARGLASRVSARAEGRGNDKGGKRNVETSRSKQEPRTSSQNREEDEGE
ncbi:hypothetical protein CC1G_00476 [Coprinopsis cinerea okayama7|uniref:Uncharacterized protein n=1 Tax=Coprinopsis cinerea (strain Okayama-7 / 130 / ATCC MYA-4618 / FGSC 9003) TaxID=240176 RepID=A8N352_COPC7|nr:hypothetical protein CC1G_00476 [Coprinopsis cinerea okayama7\|eukprot:XP_001829297.2 hypothetical protein CC1G_00476 [Coprinopsis cinerea okayama7\